MTSFARQRLLFTASGVIAVVASLAAPSPSRFPSVDPRKATLTATFSF